MKKLLILSFVFLSTITEAQVLDTTKYRVVAANPSLQQRSGSWQKAWGTNRRAEWAKEVTVPVLWLDQIGLVPYQSSGGGNETRSLRLRSKDGKEYALRSINKSREEVIEERFKGSFVEDIINDQLSSSHPYGTYALSIMQHKAGIFHPVPALYYVPKQAALDSFNTVFGDELYSLEERPDGDWSKADHLGNFKKYISTEKLIEELQEDNDNEADQYAFIKARLFDMLIADWDRHEDNFRWGKKTKDDKDIYVPIARDRDQAFYTHNGWLIDRALPIGGFSFMQNFDHQYGNIKSFNYQERYYDRFFSNEMELDDWVNAAKELQQALADTVIAASVQQLPAEIYAISGQELIDKLRLRREQLVTVATTYYLFIAKEVDIVGTKKREHFDISRNTSGETTVAVHKISKKGKKEELPYYQRTFKPGETDKIRIHGIDDEDIYNIAGTSPIRVRIIGGPAKDSVLQTGDRIHIYDNKDNVFQTSSARMHLSNDSTVHVYNYKNFEYGSKGWQPIVSYDREDRVYIGLNYGLKEYKWRRQPYASKHNFGVNYSITQHTMSVSYGSVFPRVIFNWDLFFRARYDAAGWRNFPGLGNETIWVEDLDDDDYYKIRSYEWIGSTGIRRAVGKNDFELSLLFHRTKNFMNPGRYVSDVFSPSDAKLFDPQNYGAVLWKYTFASVNDEIVPTKGFSFAGTGAYMKNFSRDQFFQNYEAKLQSWLPLSKKFSLCIRAGGSTIVGKDAVLKNTLPYQHAIIGGPDNFRGYRVQRFWGKTSFYNNNELRFITNMRTHLLNAKIGLLAFFDNGRVWMPGETSDLWHSTYGGGLFLAPFHFTSFILTYGVSDDSGLVQFRINTLF